MVLKTNYKSGDTLYFSQINTAFDTINKLVMRVTALETAGNTAPPVITEPPGQREWAAEFSQNFG